MGSPSGVPLFCSSAAVLRWGCSAWAASVRNRALSSARRGSLPPAALVPSASAAAPPPPPSSPPSPPPDHDPADTTSIDAYNAWIEAVQADRNAGAATSSSRAASAMDGTLPALADMATPPPFSHPSLFHDGVEEYAMAATTPPSAAFVGIAQATAAAGLFAPCMVGGLEGKFLTFVAAMSGASRVLDVGTFTGYSALAFAEGLSGADAEVVTIEADPTAADVAQAAFDATPAGARVRLLRGDARVVVAGMAEAGEKFDLVFLDADKGNYGAYYEAGLSMLADGGTLLADNALCSLLYAPDDPVRNSLHTFAQRVAADPRVEQVMLPVREGILLVRKVASPDG